MKEEGFVIRRGFDDAEREAVARLYFEAFEGKIGRLLGGPDAAGRYLVRALDPRFALVATRRDGSGILGVAGMRVPGGSFTGGFSRALDWQYGRFGALWRSALLSCLERGIDCDEVMLDGLAVRADMRGRGIGTALLRAVEAEAVRRGAGRVLLDVADSNPGAQALYARQGYQRGEERDIGLMRVVFGFRRVTEMTKRV